MKNKNNKLSWKNSLLTENSNIFDAIKCIDKNKLKIALVVNKKKKFVGTITDGDIRRGLINKINLNSSLKKILKKNSFYATNDMSDEATSEILRRNNIKIIPILNKKKEIVSVKFLDKIKYKNYKNTIVIMAGGKGTRLLPLTKKVPKPMLMIRDKPIIEHILIGARDEGFKNFIFTVGYLSKNVKKFFNNGKNWNVNIKYFFEKKPLGTAGSLGAIKSKGEEPIIVCNGDIISSIKFENLLEFHKRNKAFATMAVKPHKIQNLYGVVRIKGKRIIKISEKPISTSNINVGVYVFSPKAFKYIKKNEHLPMNRFIERLLGLSKEILAYPIYETWLDIGTPKEFNIAKKKYYDKDLYYR